ncbi:MAG TPA: peptidase domain-containing protein [Thermomicrobiales bacterium]|nr:peptidase domain-containing protein [Thermomicrobiales bacterium]
MQHISPAVRLAAVTLTLLVTALMPFDVGAVAPGNNAFERTWARTDLPVASNAVSRTWMWGPSAFTSPMVEWMSDNPGNGRVVQYFDKSRMEITDPNADPSSIWYVTNGLLARELVTGQLQLGLDDFQQREPADVNVAGDEIDPNAPTYRSFAGLLDTPPLDEGQVITARVDRAGNVSDDPALAERGVTATAFVPETNHRIAAPFWDFMNASGLVHQNGVNVEAPLFESPFFATGLPITEAYWTRVTVNGEPRDVLVQVFERRVLTYTPDNEPAWQVEAGNVGRHYYQWRYGVSAPDEPPATPPGTQNIGPTPLPSFFDNAGRTRLTVANHAPQPLTVTLQGPEPRTIDLPPCEGCQSTNQPPSACSPDAPTTTLDIAPGNYLVTSSRPAGNVLPLSGPWTLAPNAGYGACFFVVTG